MRISNPDLTEDQQYYKELQKERDEVETELEISRPLINLVDNLVRMGSLYGGQNELIAQEFYKVSHLVKIGWFMIITLSVNGTL